MKTKCVCQGLVLLGVCLPAWASAQVWGGVEYPAGEASFADAATLYLNDAADVFGDYANPEYALGPPDYDEVNDTGYTSLGNAPAAGLAGELVVEFVDNRLVDVAGPDLYIYEVGPTIEDFEVSVSVDGLDWYRLGTVGADSGAVDLADYVLPDAEFGYVRVRDVDDGISSGEPRGGPDIDAVGAVGTVLVDEPEGSCARERGRPTIYGGRDFDHGSVSFADQVVFFEAGVGQDNRDALDALGAPDNLSVSVGEFGGGERAVLTVLFKDNELVDGRGDDLFIFQRDPQSSPFEVEVSPDGDRWYALGRGQGSRTTFDLSDAAVPIDGRYRFVRVVAEPGLEAAGASFAPPLIDAIGAIASCDLSLAVDSDADGVPDVDDRCPFDDADARRSEHPSGATCSWPYGAGDVRAVECDCSTSDGRPGGGALLVGGFLAWTWARRRKERVKAC